MWRILFLSSPASPLGKGDAGGVEITLTQLGPALVNRGHSVSIVAPAGSSEPKGVTVHQIPGSAPPNVTTANRHSKVITTGYGVLEAMWDCAREIQSRFDVIIGMTHDWLSFFVSPYLTRPVLHWVTVASTVEAIDQMIRVRFAERPEQLAFYSLNQALTFPFIDPTRVEILYGAVDMETFRFNPAPDNRLCWVGRISPEKGLDDAASVAAQVGLPLDICGKMQDAEFFRRVIDQHPEASLQYHGMLSHLELREIVGNSIATLVTPKWIEAFGLTVIESLSCGTPVLAYRRGGPSEVVQHGINGYLIRPDDIAEMAAAVGEVRLLKRSNARVRAEQFSINAMVDRCEAWIQNALTRVPDKRAILS